jgi:hypothetical protein
VSRLAAWGLFAAGLAVRVSSFGFMGMDDMKAYVEWGDRANAQGLAPAYSGIYFPFQWQIFQVCSGLVAATGWPYPAVFKAATLAFELGILVLLARLLEDEGLPKSRALVYWCHPTFLMFAVLGYIDAHYAFFCLLAAWLANRARDARGFAIAGLPLAAAFLMKPQTLSLLAIAFFHAGARWVRRGDRSGLALFAAPLAVFAAYSVALALGGRSIWALALTVIGTTSVMPAMTANQLNMWFPVAWLVEPERPVYFVADTAAVLGPLTIRDLAAGLTLSLLAAYAWTVEAARAREGVAARPSSFTLLFAFASLVLPMVMTNAHENHFFLAGALLVVLLARAQPAEKAASHVLLALSGLNLFGLYGVGLNDLSARLLPLTSLRTAPVAAAGGALAALCFALLAPFFLRLAEGRSRGPAPALWLGAAIVALQGLVVAVLGSPVLLP